MELTDELGNITKIPYTKTSFVHILLKNKCLYGGDTSHRLNYFQYRDYHDLMSTLIIQSVSEYEQLKRAFMGGFTHASAHKVGKEFENVSSFDFTSSYPYVALSEFYPMSKARIVKPKTRIAFLNYLIIDIGNCCK